VSRALPSRDREGAVSVLQSRDREGAVRLRFCPNRHRLPLLLYHVPDRGGNIIPIPQPASTAVARPPLAIRSVRAALVQPPARIRLEIAHHTFGLRLCFNYGVNVIGPNVRRQKRPLSMRANLPYRVQHSATSGRIQQVRSLVHQIALVRCSSKLGIRQTMARNVVVPIHGTGFVSVNMRAIARERNQVRHAKLFYTAPSRSRLGRSRSRLGRTLRHTVQHYKDNSLR
jgi:hypothetical protein